MASFIISQLNNITIDKLKDIYESSDDDFLNKITKQILKGKNKDIVSLLLSLNKISKELNHKLLKFILKNNYDDLFFKLNYDIFDVHINNDEAIIYACKSGNCELFKFLHDKCNIFNKDLLCDASSYGHLNIVEFLIEKGYKYSDSDYYCLTAYFYECHKEPILYEANKFLGIKNDDENNYVKILKILKHERSDLDVDRLNVNHIFLWLCKHRYIKLIKIFSERTDLDLNYIR